VNVSSLSDKGLSRQTLKIKKGARQEQIAQTALAVVAQHGLNYLNIGTLACEVGVAPSAIYRYFPSKDAMLKSLLELIARLLQKNVTAVCQKTPDSLEQLHLLMQRHVNLANQNAGIPRVLFSEQIFAGDAERRNLVDQTFHGYLAEIARIIRAGQRQGHIRPTVPANVAAVMFLGLIQPAVILQLISNGHFDAARHAERAWKLFREMLQVPGLLPPVAPLNKRGRNKLKKISNHQSTNAKNENHST
jgi:TetR/AcrR family fatty acid metabolism transcriptional regulator